MLFVKRMMSSLIQPGKNVMINMENKALKMASHPLTRTQKHMTKNSLAVIALRETHLIYSRISSVALIHTLTFLFTTENKTLSNSQNLMEHQQILKLYSAARYLNSTTVLLRLLHSIEINCNQMEDQLIKKKLK